MGERESKEFYYQTITLRDRQVLCVDFQSPGEKGSLGRKNHKTPSQGKEKRCRTLKSKNAEGADAGFRGEYNQRVRKRQR